MPSQRFRNSLFTPATGSESFTLPLPGEAWSSNALLRLQFAPLEGRRSCGSPWRCTQDYNSDMRRRVGQEFETISAFSWRFRCETVIVLPDFPAWRGKRCICACPARQYRCQRPIAKMELSLRPSRPAVRGACELRCPIAQDRAPAGATADGSASQPKAGQTLATNGQQIVAGPFRRANALSQPRWHGSARTARWRSNPAGAFQLSFWCAPRRRAVGRRAVE